MDTYLPELRGRSCQPPVVARQANLLRICLCVRPLAWDVSGPGLSRISLHQPLAWSVGVLGPESSTCDELIGQLPISHMARASVYINMESDTRPISSPTSLGAAGEECRPGDPQMTHTWTHTQAVF